MKIGQTRCNINLSAWCYPLCSVYDRRSNRVNHLENIKYISLYSSRFHRKFHHISRRHRSFEGSLLSRTSKFTEHHLPLDEMRKFGRPSEPNRLCQRHREGFPWWGRVGFRISHFGFIRCYNSLTPFPTPDSRPVHVCLRQVAPVHPPNGVTLKNEVDTRL